MAGILSAFGRGAQKKDPMRESAALTTVYLLEQNRKFERFMQQRIDELESRVAAQQARLSTREEAEERELWAALEAGGDVDEVMAPLEPVTENEPEPETPFDTGDEPVGWPEAVPAPQAPVPSTKPEGEAVPDYLALMGGAVEAEAKAEVESSLALASASDEETFPADQNEPPDDIPVDEEELPSPAGDFTEQTDETAEIVPWMEAFSVAAPDSDEADALWPELEGDEFELLAGADDEPLTPGSAPAVDRSTGLDESAGPPPGNEMPAVTSLTTGETFGDEGTYLELHGKPDEPPVEEVYPELHGEPDEPPVEGSPESVQGDDPGSDATGREPPDDTEMPEFEREEAADEEAGPATTGSPTGRLRSIEETGADPETTALKATDDPARLGEAATEDEDAWDIPLSEGEKDDWT